MTVAAEMLRQWHREDPVRLLQAALWQAERLAEMAPELEALQTAQVTRLTTYQLVSPFSERFLRSPVVKRFPEFSKRHAINHRGLPPSAVPGNPFFISRRINRISRNIIPNRPMLWKDETITAPVTAPKIKQIHIIART